MMPELLPKPKGTPGRRRTVTAKAWIARHSARGEFISKVSLGDGRVHALKTGTHRREQALAFNRTHLLSKLSETPAPPPPLKLETAALFGSIENRF